MKRSIEVTTTILLGIKDSNLVLREGKELTLINLQTIKNVHCRGRKTIPAKVLYKLLYEEREVWKSKGAIGTLFKH